MNDSIAPTKDQLRSLELATLQRDNPRRDFVFCILMCEGKQLQMTSKNLGHLEGKMRAKALSKSFLLPQFMYACGRLTICVGIQIWFRIYAYQ